MLMLKPLASKHFCSKQNFYNVFQILYKKFLDLLPTSLIIHSNSLKISPCS